MMMKWALFLFFLFPFLFAKAADITTKSGKIYKNYSVAGTSAEGLTILHSNGGVTIPLEDWPENRRGEIAKYVERVEKRRKAIERRPDLVTKSGTVYKKYKLLGFNASGAKISHWGGNSIVKIQELPEAVQKEHKEEIAALSKAQNVVLEATAPEKNPAPFPADLQRTESSRRTKKTTAPTENNSIETSANGTTVSIGGNKKTKKVSKSKKSSDKDKEKDK